MSSATFSPVTHVIFDVDGLLLDTESLYSIATGRVAALYGKSYPWELKVTQMGQRTEVCANIIIEGLSLPLTVEEYLQRIKQHQIELFPTTQLMPDTEKLYTVATQNVTSHFDKEYTWDLKVKCMGMKGEISAKLIIDELQLPLSVPQYFERINQQYEILFPTAALLPDSVELYQLCHNKALLPFGPTLSFDDMMELMGHSSNEVADHICSRFRLPLTKEEYKQRVSFLHPQVFPFVKLMKGAEKLVRHLHSYNIPIAIASGGSKESFNLKTTNHKEFMALFNHVVLASTDPDVKAGKPSPDVFLICAQRFPGNPDPKKCLVFEDAPNGVQAGCAAQMQVVMVPDSRLDRNLTKGACQVLRSLEEFKPELFGLPAYES